MTKEKVELMVEGGKATAGAQMGQTLGPLKVNIQTILEKINEKTSSFSGMKVPVKIIIDTETKNFEIEIGTPPVSELIKNEISAEKGAGEPNKNKIANLSIEQIIKIAEMKQDSMVINNFKSAVKSIVGSCNSAGVLVEGEIAKDINKKIDSGIYDTEINTRKKEPDKEKKNRLEQQLKDINERIQKELEKEKSKEVKKKPEVEGVKEEVKEEIKEEIKGKKEEIKEKKEEIKKEKKK